mmetsp:Transcript_3759/g.12172  ORF Transcript_3759/g.12172 Transcript_3759/m.12172 type:complete len:327 (-) Transcript_3759:13-993(-)
MDLPSLLAENERKSAKLAQLVRAVQRARDEELANLTVDERSRVSAALGRIKAAQQRLDQLARTGEPTASGPPAPARRSGGSRVAALVQGNPLQASLPSDRAGFRPPTAAAASVAKDRVPPGLLLLVDELRSRSPYERKIFKAPASNAAAVGQLVSSLLAGTASNDALRGQPTLDLAQALLSLMTKLKVPLVAPEAARALASMSSMAVSGAEMPSALHRWLYTPIMSQHRDALRVVVELLADVALCEDVTRLEPDFLAECVATSLTRHTSSTTNAVEGLIVHFDFVFAPFSDNRVFNVTSEKSRAVSQDHDEGFVDNRYDYMARGYS